MTPMQKSGLSLLVSLLLGNHGPVFAEEVGNVDTSDWKCKYCEVETGLSTYVEGGLGFVTEDSFKFGEYNGLHEKGVYFIGNMEARYRNPDNANYWDINVTDIGLDSRSLGIEGGRQGLYQLSLHYDELPHYISDTAQTPFAGSGEDRLTLPAGWVTGGTTAAMSQLNNSLVDVNLETQRQRLGVAAMLIPFRQWQTSIDYRHETREGKRRIAGSFYFNSAELVQPVDYITDTVDAAASYSGKVFQARLAYQTSSFKNANNSLTWDNPYTPIVAGADQGQLALAPDNQFHQLLASLAASIGESSQASVNLASGRMTQNQDYLEPTLNPNLAVSLPATSLDGRVDTKNASVKWVTRFGDRYRLNASYQYSDRDNQTPQLNYQWVTTDVNIAGQRTNLPYSYTRNTYKLSGEHKPTSNTSISLGYDNQQYERTFQEVENSEEVSVWAALTARNIENASFRIKGQHQRRQIDNYQVVPEISGPENPIMRKYNMANRDRDTLGMRLDYAASNEIALGINLDLGQDDYPDSDLGLVSGHESSVGFDASFVLSNDTSANIYAGHEIINSRLRGSRVYAQPDWSGSINDNFEIAGAGLNHVFIADRLDMGVDYVYSESRSRITITEGGVNSQLPSLVTRLNSIKFYGNYRLSEELQVHGSYRYEHYDSRDWALDDVSENTVSNNLGLGQETPAYNISVFMVSVRYKF